MSTVVVRYKPKADRADENQSLIEAVFAELAESDPGGVKYAAFRLDDGSFVHIADIEGEANPLASLASFGAFTENIGDRCQPDHTPDAQPAAEIGNYRF